ncbi:unnamed protein product [Amoebophrya sp. A120]|nr:unnamed protein product [Amoebophrya sp. A120]|eukprot:GSA120T00011830001.1
MGPDLAIDRGFEAGEAETAKPVLQLGRGLPFEDNNSASEADEGSSTAGHGKDNPPTPPDEDDDTTTSIPETTQSLEQKAHRFAQQRRLQPKLLPRQHCLVMVFGQYRAVIWRSEALLFGAEQPEMRQLALDLKASVESRYRYRAPQNELAVFSGSGGSSDPSGGGALFGGANGNGNHQSAEGGRSSTFRAERVERDFEVVVVQHLLDHVCNAWERRLLFYRPILSQISKSLAGIVHSEDGDDLLFRVSNLLPLRDSLGSFTMQLQDAIGALETTVSSDEAMLSMLLTEKSLLGAERRQLHVQRMKSAQYGWKEGEGRFADDAATGAEINAAPTTTVTRTKSKSNVLGDEVLASKGVGGSKKTTANYKAGSSSKSATSGPPLSSAATPAVDPDNLNTIQRNMALAVARKVSTVEDDLAMIDARYHTTIEIMLEEFARQLNGVLSEVLYMQKRLDAKQELVTVSMSSSRNQILRLNLYLSIAGLACMVPTTIAGFFGMNLDNGIDFHLVPYIFEIVTVSSSGIGLLAALYCFRYLKRSHQGRNNQDRIRQLKSYGRLLEDLDALDRAFLHGILPRLDAGMAAQSSMQSKLSGAPPVTSNQQLSVADFREIFQQARPDIPVSEEEAQLVFDMFDVDRSGALESGELESLRPNKRGRG